MTGMFAYCGQYQQTIGRHVGLRASPDCGNRETRMSKGSKEEREGRGLKSKDVKDAQGSPMAMRADYSHAMTRRASRVILSSVLVLYISRPATPTFGLAAAHRTDLGPNIGLHSF
jgi:hypothetical protein